MILDSLSGRLVARVVELCGWERGRRLPLHAVHKWWSRRFAAVYRMLLAAYLFDSEREVLRAVEEPAAMRSRARGKVFFEPMMGGGTGLAEAVLAGWDAQGIDVNPVAVLAAGVSASVAAEGLPPGYREKAEAVLKAALDSVRDLWQYGSGLVCHIFVSRGKAPTWLSVGRGKLILLCPSCYTVFEANGSPASCPACGSTVEATVKPVVQLPTSLSEEAPGWRAFAVEVREPRGGRFRRMYLSAVRDEQLEGWLVETAARAREAAQPLAEALREGFNVFEADRLRRAGINYPYELFTARQLASFRAYAEAASRERGASLALLAAAASDSAKGCSLLAKWYPKLGEVIPAGGVKANWVPEYTAAVNPLAHRGLTPMARGTIASALRAQLRAGAYVERVGGASSAGWSARLGDARDAEYPEVVDLAVLDPPYGRMKSYASLSAPYFYALRVFEAASGVQLTGSVKLEEVEAREAVSRAALRDVVERVARKLSSRLREGSGRAVLMYNALSPGEWEEVLQPFRASGLYSRAVYWVLGEAPSGITSSRLKGMFLIVFAAEPGSGVHMVLEEPLAAAKRLTVIDEKLELRAAEALFSALKQVYGT
ncbi:MAG: hypothetical protein QXJ21_02190 [Thermofilum sp.]